MRTRADAALAARLRESRAYRAARGRSSSSSTRSTPSAACRSGRTTSSPAIREILQPPRARTRRYRLTFCLLGVASPTDLIAEPALTPFNVGRRIELTDFTEAEACRSPAGLGRPPDIAAAMLRRVLFWTGAHPYLTQRLCQAVALDERGQTRSGRRSLLRGAVSLAAGARSRRQPGLRPRASAHRIRRPDGAPRSLCRILRGQAPADDTRTSPLVAPSICPESSAASRAG